MRLGLGLSLTAARSAGGADTTAPTILLFAVGPQSGTDLPISLNVSDTGPPIDLFVVGITGGASTPSAAQIIAGTDAANAAAPFVVTWQVSVSGSTSDSTAYAATGLYDFYAVARDAAGNVSAVISDLGISYTAPILNFVDTMDYAAGAYLDAQLAYTSIELTNSDGRIQADGAGVARITNANTRTQMLKYQTALNPNQYAEITFSAVGSQAPRLCLRIQDASNYYYVDFASTQTRVRKLVAGVVTSFGSLGEFPSPTAGQLYRFEAEGTTLRLYRDSVLLATYTGETSLATGQPGFRISSVAGVPAVTRFACGEL